MSSTVSGLLSLYAAIFLLAGNGYFAKQIGLEVFDITAYRSILAAAILFAFLYVFKKSIRLLHPRHYLLAAILGGLLGIHWVTYFHSMRVSTVALGMTMLYTYPIMTIFLERVIFKKVIRPVDIAIGVMVFIGVSLMAFSGSSDIVSSSSGNMEGVITGLISAFCFSLRNVCQQRYFRGYPAYQTIFYQVLVIAIALLPFTDVSMGQLPQLGWTDLGLLLLLGTAFTALPHSLLANSLRSISAKSVALIGCSQPVIGAVIAFVLLSEQPTMQVVIGALIVLSGAVYETLKPGKV